MWHCVKCREGIEDSFDTCWNCGTSVGGIEDSNFQIAEKEIASEHLLNKPTETESSLLSCPRCDEMLSYVGTKKFHEGTRWGVLGDLGELFVNKERFDVYCCPRCGRVEFFVDGVGEEFRPH